MKKNEYKIDDLQMIVSNTVSLNLVPKDKGKALIFRPGQYGLISFLRGNVLSVERPFSFASSTLQGESLQFGFRICGQFTGEISKLKKGDSVFVRGPFGSFIYDEKKYKDTVFLAAGIGITPFLSAIRYVSGKALSNTMTLLYSNNFVDEIPFYKELKDLETINPNFSSYFLITKGEVDPTQKQFIPGRISKSIILESLKGTVEGKTFFICGPEPFMIAAIGLLKELGVRENDIKTEGFSQVPLTFFEKGTSIFPLVAGTSALVMFATFMAINQIEVTKAMAKYQADPASHLGGFPQLSAQINIPVPVPTPETQPVQGVPRNTDQTIAATPAPTTIVTSPATTTPTPKKTVTAPAKKTVTSTPKATSKPKNTTVAPAPKAPTVTQPPAPVVKPTPVIAKPKPPVIVKPPPRTRVS